MEILFLVNGTERFHLYPSDYGWHLEDGFFHVVRVFDDEIDEKPDYVDDDGEEVMLVACYPEYSVQYIRNIQEED